MESDRRERILHTAEIIFFRDGFYKVTLEELVSTLRISKSTIYELFGSKEGLVECIVDRLNDKLEHRLRDICEDGDLDVEGKILRIAEYQGEIAKDLRNRFMEDLKLHSPILWEKYAERRQFRIQTYYKDIIHEGIRNGLFREDLGEEFILQLYLKMSEIVSYSDIMDHLPMTKPQAYKAIIKVFVDGTRKTK